MTDEIYRTKGPARRWVEKHIVGNSGPANATRAILGKAIDGISVLLFC